MSDRFELWCDWRADPVWRRVHDESIMVSLSSLPLSDRLRQELRGWADRWEAMAGGLARRVGDETEWRAFVDHGRHLRNELQRELGPDVEVVLRYDSPQ